MSENDTSETMADVGHTNPYTGETAGQLFSRGPTVATDGGEPSATDRNRRTESRTMKDVDHTPPKQAADANRVFERGSEHEDEDAVEDVE
ncbi:hypothetical protein [Natronorubrum sp. A-ect3]|uniref:hypothetical protein n=1 Tax=Natronorubrum sp. A-ect3 TaxID=3242698 RepID=UPI00359DC414